MEQSEQKTGEEEEPEREWPGHVVLRDHHEGLLLLVRWDSLKERRTSSGFTGTPAVGEGGDSCCGGGRGVGIKDGGKSWLGFICNNLGKE